jgi:transposase
MGGWRHSKLDPHGAFLERRIAEKPDITMSELAVEMAAKGVTVAPASLSRWLIRHGYRYKKNAAGIGARSPRDKRGA